MKIDKFFSRILITNFALFALILVGIGPSLAMSGKPATQVSASKEHAGDAVQSHDTQKEHGGKEHAGDVVQSRDIQIEEIEKKEKRM